MKYCVLSFCRCASPSSIDHFSSSHTSSTSFSVPFFAASSSTVSTALTFFANTFASCLSPETLSAAAIMPPTKNAIGAIHGSSFANVSNALPAVPPMAERAPSSVAPAMIAADPATVTTPAATFAAVEPESGSTAFPSSVWLFRRSGTRFFGSSSSSSTFFFFASSGFADAVASLLAPQPMTGARGALRDARGQLTFGNCHTFTCVVFGTERFAADFSRVVVYARES
eukprot:29876-Pelagococcus_subviridis.AAC.4